MANGPPRVFVSSTIFDFRDLRSALRFWLTELGYDAQLSEYNDFTKPLDTSSFDACLRGVEAADYFILLLGSRVGGLFDEAARISITRQEYRRAYDAFKATGKPRIVTFVRGDVWAVRDDRRALEALIENDESIQREVPKDLAARIAFHASRTVNDAKAIFDFIDEVKRKDEMIAAAESGTGFPAGNWIHVFNDFADVVATLRQDIRLGSIRRAAVESNLRAEFVAIADELMVTETGSPKPMRLYAAGLRPRLPNDFDGMIEATGEDLARLAGFGSMAGCGEVLTTAAIDEAIRSGEFLEWDPRTHAYAPTLIHRGLVRLRNDIALLRRQGRPDPTRQEAQRAWLANWRDRASAVQQIPANILIPYFAMHDRHENILTLAGALHAALSGRTGALDRLRLWPNTPLGSKRNQTLRTGTSRSARLGVWLDTEAGKVEA